LSAILLAGWSAYQMRQALFKLHLFS
jgi:hypothetical protein